MTRRRSPSGRTVTLLGVAVAALAAATPAAAQEGGKGFLFSPPKGGLVIRGGISAPSASSDLFDYATDTLTLGRKDFVGFTLNYEVEAALPDPRFMIVVGSGFSTASAPSEFRNWSDNNDQPITQTTRFTRIPVTAGLKAYLTPRGRTIGRYAWVPARVAPYVSAGGGAMWYKFRQEGDFIDFASASKDVFTGTFQTDGWGPAAYGAAGLDLSLSPHVALTADARYSYARASVGGSFTGFDKIDLGGFAMTLGFNLR